MRQTGRVELDFNYKPPRGAVLGLAKGVPLLLIISYYVMDAEL